MPQYFPEVDPETGLFVSSLVQDAIESTARTAGAAAFAAGPNVTFTPQPDGTVTIAAGGGDWGSLAGKPAVIAAGADAAAARAVIGAGISDLALGTTSTTAKAGDWLPAWADVSGKPAVIAAGATQTDARTAIDAASVGHTHDDRYYTETEADGRFVRTVNGTGPDGSGNVVVTGGGSTVDDLDDVPDSATRLAMTTGERTKLAGVTAGAEPNVNADWNAATGDAQILNKPALGTSAAANIGTSAGQVKPGDWKPAAADVTDSTATGRSVLTAASAAAARTAIGAGTSSLALGTTSATAKAGDYQPTAANISDATATGRSVLTAASATAARTAIGAGDVDKSYILSRSGNLVTNGSGYLGANTNFSWGTFDASSVPDGVVGAFLSATGSGTRRTDELLPIRLGSVYTFSYRLRETIASVAVSRHSSGFEPFDSAGLLIEPRHYMFHANTTTTLAQALNPGDTTMKLTSPANWYGTTGKNAAANTHFRAAIFWNYTDPGGKTWPVHTYSRNHTGFNAWADGGIAADGTVTLSAPWAGAAVPAGTQVSNATSGAAFMYFRNNVVQSYADGWVTHAISQRLMPAPATDAATGRTSATLPQGWMPPGAAQVKLMWTLNYTGSDAGARQVLADIIFTDTPWNTIRSVKDYGVVGDGVADDTDAFNSAVVTPGRYTVPPGAYLIDATKLTRGGRGIAMTTPGVTLALDSGAVIKVKPNSSATIYTAIDMIASDCAVIGGQILGDVDTHTGTTGEWGMGISIKGDRSVVDGTRADRCWGDGIYVGNDTIAPKGVVLNHVRCDSNRRQGMTIAAVDGCVIDSPVCTNTGTVKLTAPGAGIDVEPNPGKPNTLGVYILNPVLNGNEYGLLVAHPSDGLGTISGSSVGLVAQNNRKWGIQVSGVPAGSRCEFEIVDAVTKNNGTSADATTGGVLLGSAEARAVGLTSIRDATGARLSADGVRLSRSTIDLPGRMGLQMLAGTGQQAHHVTVDRASQFTAGTHAAFDVAGPSPLLVGITALGSASGTGPAQGLLIRATATNARVSGTYEGLFGASLSNLATGAALRWASATDPWWEFFETTDPAAPALNGARLFARDNGSGKTQLCVRFPTGAVQVISTEP